MLEPTASVIVLAWNGMGYLESCLKSLLSQDFGTFEVIVVDNGSTDGSPDFVAQHYPQVKLIRNERNLGFAAGNNVGLRAATGDILVLLNQDTQVQPGWLGALIDTFSDPGIGMVGCKLLYPDGTIQHAGGFLQGARGESAHIGRHMIDDGQYDQLADAEFVTAAALGISRTALATIGPLDEEFVPAYYEDIDWCYRARAAGFRVVYQPRAVVIHHESASTSSPSYDGLYALHQGRLRFLFKHRPLEQLLKEFLPAERAWLEDLGEGGEKLAAALHRAYISNLFNLPELVQWRQALLDVTFEEAQHLANLILALRTVVPLKPAGIDVPARATVSGPVDQAAQGQVPSTDLDGIQRLRQRSSIQQISPQSEVPVLGPLLSALRRLWNRAFTEWYIVPMIQQQNEFNALLIEHLAKQSYDHRRLAEVLVTYVAESGGEIAMLAQEILKLRPLLETESDEDGQN